MNKDKRLLLICIVVILGLMGCNIYLQYENDKLTKEKDNYSYRTITSIESVETVETKCIEVDSPTHTYLAGYSLIPTHNTNKEIKTKSYYDSATKKQSMMNYPLNNLQDCSYYHYTLQ